MVKNNIWVTDNQIQIIITVKLKLTKLIDDNLVASLAEWCLTFIYTTPS